MSLPLLASSRSARTLRACGKSALSGSAGRKLLEPRLLVLEHSSFGELGN